MANVAECRHERFAAEVIFFLWFHIFQSGFLAFVAFVVFVTFVFSVSQLLGFFGLCFVWLGSF